MHGKNFAFSRQNREGESVLCCTQDEIAVCSREAVHEDPCHFFAVVRDIDLPETGLRDACEICECCKLAPPYRAIFCACFQLGMIVNGFFCFFSEHSRFLCDFFELFPSIQLFHKCSQIASS